MENELSIAATPESLVVQNIKNKRDLLLKNSTEHEKIKTALICDSGLMLGVFGGGVVTGLEECGLTETFDYAIGVSAGAPNSAYFLSGQTRLGTSIYYEDLVDNKFIDFKRLRKIADLDLLEKVFRGEKGNKRLEVEAVKSSRSKLLIAVTNAKTGTNEFIDCQDSSVDIVSAIKASCAIPIIYNQTININGVEYSDGNASEVIPIFYAANELGCNNILVILQRPFDYHPNGFYKIGESLMANITMRNSPNLRKGFLSRHDRFTRVMDELSDLNSEVNIGFIGIGKTKVSKYSMNRTELEGLANLGREKALEVFS